MRTRLCPRLVGHDRVEETPEAMAGKGKEIVEYDEAGNVVATYVQSQGDRDGVSRVDMIVRPINYPY